MLIDKSLADLKNPGKHQIGALDALRTVAVLLVMNGHMAAAYAAAYGSNAFSRSPITQNGWIGVDLFFVLSGFFIGGQLWKELKRTQTVSFRQFFIRRGLRIWPLYFVMFGAIFFLYHSKAVEKHYGWSDLIFVSNYVDSGIIAGSWSLCTEEQFYILAPLTLILTAPLLKTVEKYRPWLFALLIAAPVLRAAIWYRYVGSFHHNPDVFSKFYYPLHGHCDGLIAGLIVSNVMVSQPKWRMPKLAVTIGLGICAFFIAHLIHKEVLDFTGLAVCFGSLAWAGANAKHSAFLSSRLFYWGSRLSYGMYLLHPYVIDLLIRWLKSIPFSHGLALQIVATAVLVAFSSILALIGYCFVEHPFLELRTRVLSLQKAKNLAAAASA